MGFWAQVQGNNRTYNTHTYIQRHTHGEESLAMYFIIYTDTQKKHTIIIN